MNLKKIPYELILSLTILYMFYLLHTFFVSYRLNKWYDNFIDKSQSGLRFFYYPNQDWEGRYAKTEVAKKISHPFFTDKGFKRNNFSLRAIGVFFVPRKGHYKFFLRSDDGSRLYIDQDLVLDNSGIHSSVEMAQTIFLKKGYHLVVIEYFQALGKAELDFSWLETGCTRRDNDLGLFFYPVVSSFQWDKDITQFQKIIYYIYYFLYQ